MRHFLILLIAIACAPNTPTDSQRSGEFALVAGGDEYDILYSRYAPLGRGDIGNSGGYLDCPGGIQPGTGSIAPLVGYQASVRTKVGTYFAICRNQLNYAKLTITAIFGDTTHISYVVNLDPNDTSF